MSDRRQDRHPIPGFGTPAHLSSTVLDAAPHGVPLATVQHAGQDGVPDMGKNTDTTAPQQTQALATPPAGTDARLIRTQAAGIAVALDTVRDAYNVARACWHATAAPDDGGQGIAVRPLADAVTRARVLKRHAGVTGDELSALMADSAYRVSKSSVANYAASFGFLVSFGIASPDTYRAAQTLRNRTNADALQVIGEALDMSAAPEARQLSFIGGVRDALAVIAGERAVERAAEAEARAVAADAAVSDDDSEGTDDTAPVGMSLDVALATLAGIGSQSWSASERKSLLAGIRSAVESLRDGSAAGSKVFADADATIAALS